MSCVCFELAGSLLGSAKGDRSLFKVPPFNRAKNKSPAKMDVLIGSAADFHSLFMLVGQWSLQFKKNAGFFCLEPNQNCPQYIEKWWLKCSLVQCGSGGESYGHFIPSEKV